MVTEVFMSVFAIGGIAFMLYALYHFSNEIWKNRRHRVYPVRSYPAASRR